MNALARIVRDLTAGREPAQADLNGLSSQELSALQALRKSRAMPSRGPARMLSDAGPMENWLSAPKAANLMLSDVGPMENWLSTPKAANRMLSDTGPMENWLSAPKATEQAPS